MSKYRKAVAAFIVPLLGLPFAQWLSGEQAFDAGAVFGAIGLAVVAAAAVYFSPNAS